MNLSRTTPAHAAATALGAAVLALGLTACGDSADTSSAPAAKATTSAPTPAGASASSTDVESGAPASDAGDRSTRDESTRHDFPGPDVVFADGGSAGSDGKRLTVTTPDGKTASVLLPTEAEGWISGVDVDMGAAGTGYVVNQSAGESSTTSLVVLDRGRLYVAKPSRAVPFGDSVLEGESGYETFTTDDGAHLLTALESGETYEWSVRNGALVPTPVS